MFGGGENLVCSSPLFYLMLKIKKSQILFEAFLYKKFYFLSGGMFK